MQSILEPGSDMMGTEFGVGSSACTGCNARGKSGGRKNTAVAEKRSPEQRWQPLGGWQWCPGDGGTFNSRNILKQVISCQGTAESTGDLFLPR